MKYRKFLLIITSVFIGMATRAEISVEVIDGTDNSVIKSTIENKAMRFLNEIKDAYNSNRALKLSGLVTSDAEMSIEMLWENVHFAPEDEYIGESLIGSADGYQIRNIPLQLIPQDSNSETDYKEGVMNFNRNGDITSFYFSIDNNTYRQIMEKGVSLNDMERRMEILDYVERFRTSYNQKDIAFLNQVFSDDALIITGKVVKPRKLSDGISLSLPSVSYTKQSKQQYLANLKRVFKNVRYINVGFDDVQIKRHGSNPNIYGVRVVQNWKTSTYSDEGYVFMVWDFTNPEAPQIHVRTWQPMYLDKAKKQALPEKEIFNLNNFEGLDQLGGI